MWDDGYALHYAPHPDGRPGAEQLLLSLAKNLGWPIATYNEPFPLGLNGTSGKVSLEPGSQLEFSANPMASVAATGKVVRQFEDEVEKITKPWGLGWIGLGVNPTARVEELDIIPLTRYRLMTELFGRTGTLGTTMMRLTSSIQLNYDYANEDEAISMLRASLALAPVSTALFGNSPFSAGKPNGWLSFRSQVWRDTDADRTGLIPEAFGKDFDFERYAEMSWKRPLMFAQNRDKKNVAGAGKSLLQISEGQLAGCELNEENELNSLRQVFTEARIKPGYVEVRSIDGLRQADRCPCVAFWTGIIYSRRARETALDVLGSLSTKERGEIWVAAGREGYRARAAGHSLQALAQQFLAVARQGLVERGLGEEAYLAPLEQAAREGKNPADRILELYNGPWKQDMRQVIRYSAERSA